MACSYKGVRATWSYSKNCWIIPFNGVNHYCFDGELEDTIDELLDEN